MTVTSLNPMQGRKRGNDKKEADKEREIREKGRRKGEMG